MTDVRSEMVEMVTADIERMDRELVIHRLKMPKFDEPADSRVWRLIHAISDRSYYEGIKATLEAMSGHDVEGSYIGDVLQASRS